MRLVLVMCAILAVPVATLSAVLALAPGASGSGNLIVNGDFADGDSGWQWLGGTFTVTDAGVGALTLTSGIAYLYQPVDIVPGSTYRFSGQLVASQGQVTQVWAKLVVSDQNGGILGPYDKQIEQVGPWTFDSNIPCQAATSGRVQINTIGTEGTVYLDDLALEVVGPVTPCPTITPTASDTPTITSSATRTPTATKTPTPTRTSASTRTSTPTRTATATQAIGTPSPTRTVTSTRTVTPTLTPSNGLLVNGGFEAADGETPAGWETFGGTLTQVGQPVREGRAAACLYSATTSTKWLYQTVPIAPGAWYEMSAYIYDDDAAVDAAWLRISWYESGDGSGGALWTVDSTGVLETPQAAYRFLTTGAVQAPANGHSASARILLRPVSSSPAFICLDDVSLTGAAPLPTPTSTSPIVPSATATPTRTPVVLAATALPTTTARPTDRPAVPAATPTPTPSHGMLVNGGFESGVDGWRTYGSALAQVGSPVWNGQYAGAFSSSGGSTSWVYQTVVVDPDAWYEMSGHVYQDDANVEAAWLRVSWYASGDGSGSAIDSVDSTEVLTEPLAAYRALTTGPVQAPPDAHSARARILLRPGAPGHAVIYIDDVFFRPAAAPTTAPSEPAGAGGSIAQRGTTTRRTGTAANQRPAGVLGVSRPPEPAGVMPQPTPVIRRSAPTALAEERSSSPRDIPAWAWILAGGVVAAFVTGGGTAWWDRRR